ncbi:hypothetical protein Ancab_021241 [Ancistrocladus abbreviatus]
MRWGKLINIDRDTKQRKRFDLAHLAIHTPKLDSIHKMMRIKVEEDVFPVTAAEELGDVTDMAVVDNSKFKPKKRVMMAATCRDDRDNDELESDNVEHVELSRDVMGKIDGGGKLTEHTFERGNRIQNTGDREFGFIEDSNGPGNRHMGMENPYDFWRLLTAAEKGQCKEFANLVDYDGASADSMTDSLIAKMNRSIGVENEMVDDAMMEKIKETEMGCGLHAS